MVTQCLNNGIANFASIRDISSTSQAIPISGMSQSVVPAPIRRRESLKNKNYGEKLPDYKDICQFEASINSNNFNAFELHRLT